MTFVRFASTDVGAPTLNGVAGTGVVVMRWILVTLGGWTEIFTTTNRAIFQSPQAHGRCIVVDDTGMLVPDHRMMVRACESASSISTLVDPFPTVAMVADSSCYWIKSFYADSTARAYSGIVTDRHIQISIDTGTTNSRSVYFSGDIEPADPSDAWATMHTVGGTTALITLYYVVSATLCFFCRDITGTVKSSVSRFGQDTTTGVIGGWTTYGSYPHPYDGKMHLGYFTAACYGSQIVTSGSTAMGLRGWLPNIMAPLHNVSIVNSGDTFIDSAYNPAATFDLHSAQQSGIAGAFLAFEITDTWSRP